MKAIEFGRMTTRKSNILAYRLLISGLITDASGLFASEPSKITYKTKNHT